MKASLKRQQHFSGQPMGADQMGLRVVAGSWTGLTVEGLRCAKLLRPEVRDMFEEHKQNLSV